MTKMLKSKIFNTVPFSILLLYCWTLQHQHHQPRALRRVICHYQAQPPSAARLWMSKMPIYSGVHPCGPHKLKNHISRHLYHVPMCSDLQRCPEMLHSGPVFVRQDTSCRTTKLSLFPSKTSPSVRFWSWCYCLFFSVQTPTTGKFISMGNDKSFRDVHKMHILLSGSHWVRSVFHWLLLNPAFSWGHPAAVEYRYFAFRGHLPYD